MTIRRQLVALVFVGSYAVGLSNAANLENALQQVRAIGPKGEGIQQATAAWKDLAAADSSDLTMLLAGMDDADLMASNWLRAAVDAVAERTLKKGEELPVDELKAFLMDRSHSPHARRVAYEWLAEVEPENTEALLPSFLDDPSLELRRDAVEKLVNEAPEGKDGVSDLQQAFTAARDLDQVEDLAKRLEDLGVEVDVQGHFGFIPRWSIIGPFNNVDGVGFARVYPPEREIDLSNSYEGKEGEEAAWKTVTTDHDLGEVDLNEELGGFKGAVCYAYAPFTLSEEGEIELRIGSIGAVKAWIDGELIFEREVYHAGSGMDQYIAPCKLAAGEHNVLLKLCQNEQTEPWAQTWAFQARLCDPHGAPVAEYQTAE